MRLVRRRAAAGPRARDRDAELHTALLGAWALHDEYDLEDERALAVHRAIETMDTSMTLYMRQYGAGREHLRESVAVGRAFAEVTVSGATDDWLGRLLRLKVSCSTAEGSGSASVVLWNKDAPVIRRAISSASSAALPASSLEATGMAAELAHRLAAQLTQADNLDAAIASLKQIVRPLATQYAVRHATTPLEVAAAGDQLEVRQHERMRA